MHIQQYGARTVIGSTDKNDQTVLHYAACAGNVLVRITRLLCTHVTFSLSDLFLCDLEVRTIIAQILHASMIIRVHLFAFQ